ncbi:MAG: Heavy metal efflux outer membrane protein [Herminiimonas sp.]|nr:Heavy metal efflux outer membrane protein [Herminiimonas sp.]
MPSLSTALCPMRNSVLRFCREVSLLLPASVLALSGNAYAAETSVSPIEARHRIRHPTIDLTSRLPAQGFLAASRSRNKTSDARQIPDPVLKRNIDNPADAPNRFSVANDRMIRRCLDVTQQVQRNDNRQLSDAGFVPESRKPSAEKNAVAAANRREAALGLLDCYYAESMAAIVAEQGRQAKFEIQVAESAYRAGRGSQADILGARIGLGMVDDRISEVRLRTRNARLMLARRKIGAVDMALVGKAATDYIRLDSAALHLQLIVHPQITVPVKGRVPATWLTGKEKANNEREDIVRIRIAEVRSMINEWESGRERHARFQHRLLPLAHQRTAAALTAYRGGKTGLADVLAARRADPFGRCRRDSHQ